MKIAIEQEDDRVSIVFDCADDGEAQATFDRLLRQLDAGHIEFDVLGDPMRKDGR